MTELLDIPAAPELRPPTDGHGELTFTRLANSHTAITRSSATSPLRILSPKPAGPSAWAFTSNFGGGLVAGDHLSLQVTANENTTCYLSTQSSTKIYRSTSDQLTQQSLDAKIAADAVLISTPDPVVCFARSRYRQSQIFHLDSRGSLMLLDAFTSGRHANDERWQLHHLESRNEVFVNERRILLDNLRLDDSAGQIASPFTTGLFNYFATLVLLGPRLEKFALALLQQIQSAPIQKNATLLYSASPLADGLILRLATLNSEAATHFLYEHLLFLPTLLGEHPWHRKW